MELTDRSAIAEVCAGNSDAYRVLVDRHSRNIFRLAYRMTGNEQDAEDVVQEAFLRAYRQIQKFDSRSSFSTWLYAIAANYSRDLIRARNRRQEHHSPSDDDAAGLAESIPSPAPAPDRVAFSGQLQSLIGPALDRLSASERTAFVLRHYEGLGIDEIAGALGIQASAAKQSVFRAVHKLRRALQP
ncbi:MAG: RNA polymerase sigma factor, partial [Bryobacteraceae bacterium]